MPVAIQSRAIQLDGLRALAMLGICWLTSERQVLGPGFEAISFTYFGAEMEDENPDWKQNWRDDAEQYPSAVRIRTRTDLGSGGWPDLLYNLRLGEHS